MDFEEQLEKAERLPTPSLVGSSIRSADDSAHNNYIHPEKSKGRKKENSQGHGILNQSIAASLDDLMREGALLGSEEDFEEVLDDSGNIKQDAKYAEEDDHETHKSHLSTLVAKEDDLDESGDVSADKVKQSGESVDKKSENGAKNEVSKADDKNNVSVKKAEENTESKKQKASAVEKKLESTPALEKKPGVSFYSQEDYSTPNLSEYQLDHQISDHKDLLTNIQSHDPLRLPNSQSDYGHDDDSYFKRPVSPSKRSSTSAVNRFNDDVTISAGATDGLHTPYFQRDSRSQSRSGASRVDRSRSRSAVAPHLARGDSYKNTNMNSPSAYELPPDLAASEIKSEDEEEEEDETQDRRSRQSKPTMGESIAAAEASKDKLPTTTPVTMQRDTSLVTTGDYTNFDVDKPEPQVQDSSNLYSMRSASSTNYLRSISRSRSRQPDKDLRASNLYNEKNDADPEELVKGGALINEDPYSTIGGLDTMVEEVLNPVSDNSEPSKNKSKPQEKLATDRDVTKKDDTKEVISTDDEEDKPNSKTLNSTIKDDKAGEIKSKDDDSTKTVDDLSSVAADGAKSNANDNQIKKSDKKDDVDVKGIEQIESSLKSKDPILDRAQSLTSDDIHGRSSEANTRFADSIISKDTETKADLKSDNGLDNAAIDQIESSIDSKDEVVEKAELLAAEDIHGKTEKSKSDASISNKKETTKKDPENSESVNTAGTGKIESSIGSKDSVAEAAETLTSKSINVETKDTKDKIVDEVVAPDTKNKNADAKETGQVKSDQSNDSTVEKINSKSIISESDESDKSTDVHASLGDATKVTEIEKEKDIEDSTVEKREPNIDSARGKKEEEEKVSKKDVDDKAIEQIESGLKASDMVTEKATSLTADDINADSTSESKSVIDDPVIEKQEVNKKDVDNKAAEQIEYSIDSNDAIAENAKSLTADDVAADSTSETKSVPNEAITEKDEVTNKKDVDDIAAEQIEYSVDSKDAITEKAKSLTSDDITADSTPETKSVPNEAVTEKDEVSGNENEDTNKNDVDDIAAEQIESSVGSNDAIAEKAKSLTADIVADSTFETKSVAADTVAEKAKSTIDVDSSKAVTSGLDGEKDKETKLADVKDTEASKNLGAKKEDPVTASKDVAAAPATSTITDDDLSDIDVSPEELRKHLESQPVYIFTSLAGGMQIMTRTNRLTTILTANGIKFEYRDLGTDEEAKKIWRRQASGKTLPGVVRGDDYIGNWQEVDEANEEYRLREILYETL